jgi:hypothetical protein
VQTQQQPEGINILIMVVMHDHMLDMIVRTVDTMLVAMMAVTMIPVSLAVVVDMLVAPVMTLRITLVTMTSIIMALATTMRFAIITMSLAAAAVMTLAAIMR